MPEEGEEEQEPSEKNRRLVDKEVVCGTNPFGDASFCRKDVEATKELEGRLETKEGRMQ